MSVTRVEVIRENVKASEKYDLFLSINLLKNQTIKYLVVFFRSCLSGLTFVIGRMIMFLIGM